MKIQVQLLVGMVLMSLVGNTQVNIANGLLAYYPYTGNANDASGNGYHANVSGAELANDRFGNENSSYSLYGDGGNGISIYSNVPYNFDNDFSYSFWVQSYSNNGAAFSWGGSQGGYYSNVYNRFTNGAVESIFSESISVPGLFCQDSRQNNGGSPAGFFGSSWHMLTTVKNGETVSFYIDGLLVDSGIIDYACAAFSTISFDVFDLEIGDPFLGGFNARVDDIMVYSRALNEEEITYLYDLTSSWSPTASLSTLESKSTINIFPNPGNQAVTITASQPTTALFMGANGSILTNLELNGETAIDVSSFAPGMYFIRTAEGQTVKFIKE
jgi:hypothetical protein